MNKVFIFHSPTLFTDDTIYSNTVNMPYMIRCYIFTTYEKLPNKQLDMIKKLSENINKVRETKKGE